MQLFRYFPVLVLSVLVLPLMAQQTVPLPVVPPSAVMDPDKVVIQVGDTKLTVKQIDDIIDMYPLNSQVYYHGAGRQEFAKTLVRTLVVAEEARKRKLNETEKFKEQIRFEELSLAARSLGQQLPQEITIDDAMLRKYFDDHRCEYETWHPRQILVRATGSPIPLRPGEKDLTDEEALAKAQSIRKRLTEGADFAELAGESDDTAGAANGGDLGQVRHGQIVPSLEEAICKMNAGSLSEPIKTPFGYHIVKMESKEFKTFDDLKPELEKRLRPEAANKVIEEWIANVKVVKDAEYFAPDQPASLSMPAPAPKKP
jgi:peptidyl-prolyl cis-trans isomerase C